MRRVRSWLVLMALAGVVVVTTAFRSGPAAPVVKVSTPFAGAKVNGGNVTMTVDRGTITLRLSDDVKDPKTPDPHWLVIDGKGQSHLLDRLTIKDDKMNQTITVPSYVKDVVKVQIWCAWAVANLGEAAF